MWIIRTLVILVLIALIVGFAIYNSDERISVNLYGKRFFDIPMIFVAFWALVAGMIVSFALGVGYYFKMYSELRHQKGQNQKLLKEITALRNLPLEEDEEKQTSP